MPELSDVELLRRLVSFDSTSRNSNLPLVDFISDYLDRPGVRIERNHSPDHAKANLVITMGPEDNTDRRGLVLSGHMDVVPAEEPGWRSDPFSLTQAEDSFVARGSCDMKGFLALAMNQLRALDPRRCRRPLVLIFTYDEEVGTRGAKHFVRTWTGGSFLPRAAIIGEPTSLRAIRMHKGHLQMRITVAGRSAHSGYPHLGLNAIEPMGRIINELTALREALQQEGGPYSEHFPDVPFVALNVARITGGTAVNIVPDTCVLEIGMRLLPTMESEPATERVINAVTNALGDRPVEIDIEGDSPPMVLDHTAAIYQRICQTIDQTETLSASYATDAGWLQSLGLECVIFGPGSIEVAHRPNESIPAADFAKGAELLRGLVHHYCAATS